VRGVRGAQEAKFLALSKGAKIDAIPSLDIATNDVTSSHKLSIAHVREGDTFYPRLRGLSDRESRALFLESHFGEVFRGDDGAKLRETLCGD
jgi:Fe-S cluster assembly scaffold protein SufB